MPFFYRMNTVQDINRAEHKWQEPVYSCVENIFSTHWLPSHDVWHSNRVWEFARSLILAMRKNKIRFSFKEMEELLIASYFHDTGMSVTLNPEHGKYSREICHTFLKNQSSLSLFQKEKILNAVEFHDDKSYRKEVFLNHEKLLPWLCVADDMDAYGNIGIYRFWEINSLRHIREDQMVEKIIHSLQNRMNFFSDVYPFRDDFYDLQQKRNSLTAEFFKRMRKEIKDTENTKPVSYTRKIIHIFKDLILTRKSRPEHLFSLLRKETCEPEVYEFFREFNMEIN